MKKTLIVGATNNSGRYAYLAGQMLLEYGHEIVPMGIQEGDFFGRSILHLQQRPAITGVDTITLYISPRHQPAWYDYLLGLHPERIIFNPGTENPEFEKRAQAMEVETIRACTLVMLRSGQY